MASSHVISAICQFCGIVAMAVGLDSNFSLTQGCIHHSGWSGFHRTTFIIIYPMPAELDYVYIMKHHDLQES